MKISQLIEALEAVKEEHGDIKVTCTHSVLPDGHGKIKELPDVFETTVENLIVGKHKTIGKKVRLWL